MKSEAHSYRHTHQTSPNIQIKFIETKTLCNKLYRILTKQAATTQKQAKAAEREKIIPD